MKQLLQSSVSEYSLAKVASHHSQRLVLTVLHQSFSLSLNGTTLQQLMRYAQARSIQYGCDEIEDRLASSLLPCSSDLRPASMPRIDMSSSTSGQWMPWPCPMISKTARCLGEALASLGNQISGAVIVGPSSRLTISSVSVQLTSVASSSLPNRRASMPKYYSENNALDEFCEPLSADDAEDIPPPCPPPLMRKRVGA